MDCELHSTIVLLHPSRLFFEGLGRLLEEKRFKLALHATSFEQVPFEALQNEDKLVFLVGGRTTAEIVEAVRSLRNRLASACIVVIGATSDPRKVKRTLEAGANGYLREAMTSETLMRAIELVLQDETVLPAEFVKSLSDVRNAPECDREPRGEDSHHTAAGLERAGDVKDERIIPKIKLSAREQAILQGLVDGEANKVIAQRLRITEATVKVHVKAILRKIRVKNRTQAAIWGVKFFALAQGRGHVNGTMQTITVEGYTK